jgi:gamma-glutamylcyclotransferase (GGCT)/AIG2-like uncharacterized protein YtfP
MPYLPVPEENRPPQANEVLFIYGTLNQPDVQLYVIGRYDMGKPDVLTDYRKKQVTLENAAYPMIFTAPGEIVRGNCIMVTPAELKQIDIYETDAYQRVRVTLRSGRAAWVYAKPE